MSVLTKRTQYIMILSYTNLQYKTLASVRQLPHVSLRLFVQ